VTELYHIIVNIILDHGFEIAVILTLIGIAFCIYGVISKKNNREINNQTIISNTDITSINSPNNINNKKEKKTEIIMGFGIAFIVLGIMLIIFIIIAFAIGIFMFIKLIEFFSELD